MKRLDFPVSVRRSTRKRGIVVDLFAGGGGASLALQAAFGHVDIALNHDATAIAVHTANHPNTTHFTADIWSVDPRAAVGRRKVYAIWASPDCTSHSRAKAGKPRETGKRILAEAVLKWVRATEPQILFMENVEEFQKWGPLGDDGHPLKEREGELFRLWVGKLRLLGYVVEWRILDASRFGAPTKRRRLFLVARRDGQPISWPDPTHGPGLQPVLTAASCIDWSIPCPSIFERKRPLADKTLDRIAEGIRRYVLENPRPFIIKVNHGRDRNRSASIDDPLSTVTATQRGHALVAPSLVQTGYGERPGQTPRALDLQEPMGTLVAGGVKQGLVAAYLVKHFGDPGRKRGGGVVLGADLNDPVPTVTVRDHNSLAALALAKFRGTGPGQPMSTDPLEPMPTISAGGIHVAQVLAFLSSRGVTREPVVMVEGVPHAIVDIGMRMLEPDPELKRAQLGEFADDFDLSAATTKGAKNRLLGNMVCPHPALALIRANCGAAESEAA